MTIEQNKEMVLRFIGEAWNAQDTSCLQDLLHEDYRDHSLTAALPANREGLATWIQAMSAAFEHHTSIQSIVAENDHVAVRIAFSAKLVGPWRGLEPSGQQAVVKGFRHFQLKDGKIIAHWALLDGEGLYAALTAAATPCAETQCSLQQQTA